ncbi:DUF1028 domain-containing protein [Limobrevibacterium gyesilva]|uniref:DUF1028 domain-containing protein n=1 Tax=Limobrevibacterium gyesilva TaxID=2991712 RepID=A0AA42CEA1_9PROT|nr:DUF1028 domain-containing protein [Limobrevibacterium gyesilva]MCW3475803.1 DUF1028 domain-containing protein [Limobrevibacterium gyesilva]
MTWSIVTYDRATGAFAIAVATKNFAVGATVPHVRAGVGAVATQSITNRYLGPAILDAMARGLAPDAAIASAIAGDAGRGLRQVHAVDRHGRSSAWTGDNCVTWCGSAAGDAVSVAGNMLANDAVVPASLAAFTAGAGLPVPERLMEGMLAGEAAGGDRRGRQSAAMVLTTTEDFPDLSIRVDDHAEPLPELKRLLAIWRRDRAPGLKHAPSKADPAGLIDLDAIEAPWIARGLDLRLRR